MKLSLHALAALPLIPSSLAAPCPLARSGAAPPDDAIHNGVQKSSIRRRRLSDAPNTKAKLDAIIENRKQRDLETTCFTTETYDAIDDDVASLANAFSTNETKGYFLGGMVRLAAHDFLDYDQANSTHPYGADGCIDWSMDEHAGLDGIWCDGCDLTAVYYASYTHISVADVSAT